MENVSTQRSIVLSVVIHLVLLVLVHFSVLYSPKPKEWIQVELIADKNLSKLENRVVQTQKVNSKESADTKFLGETNQKVEREQVSNEQKTQIAKSSSSKATGAPSINLSNLGIAMVPKNFGSKELEQLNHDRTAEQDEVSQKAQEYVKGFKAGDSTLLNTKEFIFYGYFQRIRERLDFAWNNSLKEHLLKHYRAGRQLASEVDYTTRLMVVLNNTGEIVKVLILEESGTRALDDAAIKAFNKAGPFPNPPKGMIDHSGMISVRWDFILRT